MSTATANTDEGRLYRLAPIDKTGVMLGLSIVQVIVGGIGLVVGAIMMVYVSLPLGIVFAIVVTGSALLKRGGDAVLHQVPLFVAFAKRGKKELVWHAPVPILGVKGDSKKTPSALTSQQLHHVDPAEFGMAAELRGMVAMVIDKKAGAYAVTLRVSGRQFGLLERHEQDWQLAQWGNILGQFVSERPQISQVQWSEWAAPSGTSEHRDWLEAQKSAQPLPDALGAWEQLLARSGPIATRHEVLVTITTHMSKIKTQKRHRTRHEATVETLLKETRSLLMRFGGAGLKASVLTPREHSRAMRLRLDPSVRATLDRREAFLGTAAGFVSDENAGPLAMKESWSWVAADNSLHRSFFVAEWPRLDVPGDWMRSLLLWSGVVRSISVFFQPIPRSKSQRAITAQATKIDADVEHRGQKGFRVGAWHRRAKQAVTEREEELVAGYVELAFGGVVTISATTMDELDQATSDITQIAAGIGVELRPLHGRHGDALVACLPVARGVKNHLAA
jgi:hypothetical protein